MDIGPLRFFDFQGRLLIVALSAAANQANMVTQRNAYSLYYSLIGLFLVWMYHQNRFALYQTNLSLNEMICKCSSEQGRMVSQFVTLWTCICRHPNLKHEIDLYHSLNLVELAGKGLAHSICYRVSAHLVDFIEKLNSFYGGQKL